MNNVTDCEIVLWSRQARRSVTPLFCICIVATVSHLLFRIQLKAFPIVRKRSMLWVYAYLATDFLLLIRFFLLYAYRWWPICVPHLLRTIICYCEAIFDNYLNLLQSYILLALSICRYLQIAHHHNVYLENRCIIIIAYFLIYFLPLLGHIMTILVGWTILQNQADGVCDLLPISLIIRILFLLFSYFIPVILTCIFLYLTLRHIRNTTGIRAQEIVDARHKYHRQIVLRSIVFCTVWLLFWSPHLLSFPFHYKNDKIGNITQILSYINITLDPIAISALDTRFLQTWRSAGDHLMRFIRRQQSLRVPVISSTNILERTIEHTINIS